MKYFSKILLNILIILFILSIGINAQDAEDLVTESEIEGLKRSIWKGRHEKLNTKVGIDFSSGGNANGTYFTKNPATNRNLTANINSSSSLGLRATPGAGTELNIEVNMDKTANGDLLHGYSFGNLFGEINISEQNFNANAKAGGPFYSGMEGTGTPLVNGEINGEGGLFLFERRDWYTVELSKKYYSDNYNAAGAYEEEDRSSSGAEGTGFVGVLNYFPISTKFVAFWNKLGGVNASWEHYFRVLKENILIPNNNIGIQYSKINYNPNNTGKNDLSQHTGSIEFSGTEFAKYHVEAAYSETSFPKEEGEIKAVGSAYIASISKQLNGFLFVNSLVPQARVYYVTPYYGSEHRRGFIRGTIKTLDEYGLVRTIIPMYDMEHASTGSITYFASALFQLFTQTGKVKLTYGESYDTKETWSRIKLPHRLNHRMWFDNAGTFKNEAGYPGLHTDGQDWDDDLDGEGISSEVFDWYYHEKETKIETKSNGDKVTNQYSYEYDYSKKKHSLFRIELYYNLSEIIPMKYPLYFISRNLFSDISFLSFYDPEYNLTKDNKDNEKVEYSWSDYFLAFGLLPQFYIIGFFSIERQVFNYPELFNNKYSWDMSVDGSGNRIYKPAQYDMKNIGYGVGYDWYFKGNMQMFLKIRWFDHYDKYRPQYDFSGYKVIIEFRTYFSYG